MCLSRTDRKHYVPIRTVDGSFHSLVTSI
jgi:hypothetical protein